MPGAGNVAGNSGGSIVGKEVAGKEVAGNAIDKASWQELDLVPSLYIRYLR